ncbi:MAG: hypothetical protein ACLFNM_01570 [Candidatus Woesearchaeota archaeon]
MSKKIFGSAYEPRSKQGGFWLLLILVIFIIGAVTYGGSLQGDEHYVQDDLSSLVYAFESLGQGNIQAFFDGLVSGIPVLAVFMIVFAIVHFLFALIFKDLFKKHHRTMLAFIIACYGFFDHRVYNWMLSLNTFAIGAIVFLTGVIMVWGLTDSSMSDIQKQRKELKPLREKSKKSKQNLKLSQDELRKLQRQLGVYSPKDKKEFQKTLKRQGRL